MLVIFKEKRCASKRKVHVVSQEWLSAYINQRNPIPSQAKMKFTIIVLSLVSVVAVVFSAPTNSNMGNGEFQVSGPSFDNNKLGGWNNNGQGQKIGQAENIVRLQGFFQLTGFGELQQPSQLENIRPLQGNFQGGNVGSQFGNQGPQIGGEKKPGQPDRFPNVFHFATGQPHTGQPGHFGGMTGQPGFFGNGNNGNRNQRTSTTTTTASA